MYDNFEGESIAMLFKDLQLRKQLFSILATEPGISIDVNCLQFSKAFLSIFSKEEGLSNLTSVKEKQFENVNSPIILIDEGMLTFFKEEQSLKTYSPICLTDEGIVTTSSEEHLLKHCLQICVKFEGFSNVTSFKEEHLQNARLPICFTEEGIEIIKREEHPSKAVFDIFDTDDGMFIFFNRQQLRNEFIHISETNGGITISLICLHPLKRFVGIFSKMVAM